jgi:hypothetical protein
MASSFWTRLKISRAETPFHVRTSNQHVPTKINMAEVVPRRARIQGSYNFVSLNSRLESNEEEEELK